MLTGERKDARGLENAKMTSKDEEGSREREREREKQREKERKKRKKKERKRNRDVRTNERKKDGR